jgi:hypothetical protein
MSFKEQVRDAILARRFFSSDNRDLSREPRFVLSDLPPNKFMERFGVFLFSNSCYGALGYMIGSGLSLSLMGRPDLPIVNPDLFSLDVSQRMIWMTASHGGLLIGSVVNSVLLDKIPPRMLALSRG